MASDFDKALYLVKERLKQIRKQVPPRRFDKKKPAEVEINKFWYDGKTVDRIMLVLRSTGCSHYKNKEGCSMCGHYDGTTETPVTSAEYIAQWKSVVNGKSLNLNKTERFDINNFPVLCLYNLGSFLNPEEVPRDAARKMFESIAKFEGIKKVIIESRAEYVTKENLENIRLVNNGNIEVGMGLESINYEIRELCHHKNLPDLNIFSNAIDLIHQYDFRALAYVNQKPPFLTESEAINDAIATAVFAYRAGVDAVSIEPTSLQAHSLTDHLHQMGQYQVPWLWSVIKAIKGINEKINQNGSLDLRIGGYFNEEILSGSQGVASGTERNELFPHTTSGNCNHCTDRVIEAIKESNRTYNLNVLFNEKDCDYCTPIWKEALKVKDSRSIPRRIIEILGGK